MSATLSQEQKQQVHEIVETHIQNLCDFLIASVNEAALSKDAARDTTAVSRLELLVIIERAKTAMA